MKKFLFLLFVGSFLLSDSYDWGDGGTILGSYGNLGSATNVDGVLVLTEDPIDGTPSGYIAAVIGLNGGETIDVCVEMYTPDSDVKGRIWGHYYDGVDITSYDGSASGLSEYADTYGAWEQLCHTWTVEDGKVGFILEARLYSYNSGSPLSVDNLNITTSAGTIIFPGEAGGFIPGCTDSNACNYDSEATSDNGSCLYDDCLGECGGTATEDCFGVCGGTATEDCLGICGGSAELDVCGVCDGDSNPDDCTSSSIFLSEYAEGSSNNKYLEIFNGTGASIDLADYSLSSCSNGCDDGVNWDYPNNVEFESGTIIANGDVYVVCNGSADPSILSQCDQTFTYLSNGDDVFALTRVSDGEILDIIGEIGDDPGNGWDVCGTSNGTKDHTLVRISTIINGNPDWTSSSSSDSCEWIVYPNNTWTYLGSHPHDDTPPVVEICDDGVDNDGDGYVDCDDFECSCGGEICDDGIDNDGDGYVDCDDFDCPPCDGGEICDDGIDNDGDGYVDCNDFDCDCSSQGSCAEYGCVEYTPENACQCNDLCVQYENCCDDYEELCAGSSSGEICDDGIDNDGDGYVDCDDFDCPPCDGGEICDDGIDNDGDGYVDCNDFDCPPCDGGEICDDGIDNDDDGYVDCDDFDCDGTFGNADPACEGSGEGSCAEYGCVEYTPSNACQCNDLCVQYENCCDDYEELCAGSSSGEICDDGIDNDGDSYVDCDDFDCDGTFGDADPACGGSGEICDDGIDNDGDGAIDGNDFDCPSECNELTDEICDDGIDNDGDGYVDCDDFDCPECGDEICGDCIDNDANGYTDCNDFACENDPICFEDCSDGIDNNNNGYVDCEDFVCENAPNCPSEICDDGIDNDYNGYTDCNDFDCSNDPACAENCYDSIDNDNDGYVDCDDFDCEDELLCTIFGCTDPNSSSFNPDADQDDGSCDYTIPIAYVGSSQFGDPGDVITLSGDGLDHDGSIIGYLWTQIEGPSVVLSDYEAQIATFVAPNEDCFIKFGLRVIDNNGNISDFSYIDIIIGVSTIYDLQFTLEQGEYCYETNWGANELQVKGIVTWVKDSGGTQYRGFFLQDFDENNLWSGIYVQDDSFIPSVGDELILVGTVNEYYSFTQLTNISSAARLSTCNVIEPLFIRSDNLGVDCSLSGEQYESMFVGISNAQFEVADQYGNWTVSDDYGTVVVDDYYFKGVWPCIEPGDQFSCLSGVVGYSYGAFKIYPRNIDDFSCLDDNCNSNGDVNLDNSIDVLDIVSIVNAIVGSDSLNEQEQCSADINEDSSIDVLDIVLIVSIILN